MSSGTYFLSLVVTLCSLQLLAQEKTPCKFGNVTVADFTTHNYKIDSNASAIVVADVGRSSIDGNTKGWFSLIYKHYKRVHILNKNGFDISNVSIPLYTDGDDEEVLDKLKAVTYNLENGKVVSTKLDVKNAVFKDKINKNRVVKKFTFPNVKEGSIIEFEYTITSDYLQNLQPWEFQSGYPRIWSEYNVMIPEFFKYVTLSRGYKSFDISDRKESSENFTVVDSRGTGASDRFSFTANVANYRWVMKNVPALKEENYTSTLDNHICKIEFQLSEYRQPLTYRNVLGTWPNLASNLMESEHFGKDVLKDNGWLKDIVRPIIDGVEDKLTQAKMIYAYVRDHFTCTNYSDLFTAQSIKNLAKSKSGTVAEINLLLTAMLLYADIDATPVILSTRSNGITYSIYPLISQYNYVIAGIKISGKSYYLDASEPRMGFAHLPIRCYNGHARVIDKDARAIEFSSDSLREVKSTSVFIINDEKGNIVGSMLQTPGYYESLNLRDRIKEKGQAALEADIKKAFGHEITISNFNVDSLEKYDQSIGIKYDFDIIEENEDIIYFNPMLGEGYKENPFKSAERAYPVEMPFALDEIYILQMDIPTGYEVDELPKSMVVKLNEQNEGMFEYRISKSESGISFRSRIRLNRANYVPEEYEMLREFFNLIVKKQAEQIVFKKKK